MRRRPCAMLCCCLLPRNVCTYNLPMEVDFGVIDTSTEAHSGGEIADAFILTFGFRLRMLYIDLSRLQPTLLIDLYYAHRDCSGCVYITKKKLNPCTHSAPFKIGAKTFPRDPKSACTLLTRARKAQDIMVHSIYPCHSVEAIACP